ncbi:MAG: YdeI/OmpD-associated family protein [Chitinophagales bacterium]|nr:YdeI/OmpD-associated family protein [Chitinophagales bacterium]
MKYSFTNPLIDLQSSVWKSGVLVPTEIASHFLGINDKRVICTLNQKKSIHVALMPKGNNTWFFNINKECQKELQIKLGDMLEISIETDESKYGMEAPEEFLELLKQDMAGKSYFEALSIGKQRTLLHQVLTAKSIEKRIEKSIIIVEYLKEVEGKLDYKSLHEAYKNSRF